MFMHLAKTYQLDPFQKEIFCWKYKGDITIMTSRDGYLKIANRHPEFDGLVSDVVHKNDSFQRTLEGVQHKYGADRGSIVGAYALVYRKDRKYPIYVFAPYEEYRADKKVWIQYPSAMILKVAESMALKRGFSVSGLVSREEMDVQESPVSYPTDTYSEEESGPVKDVTPEVVPEKTDAGTEEAIEGSVEETVLDFGKKYNGKKLKDVPTYYLTWMLKQSYVKDSLKAKVKKVIGIKEQQKQTEDKASDENNEDNKKKRKQLSERQIEIMSLIGKNEELKKDVMRFLDEQKVEKVDDLDENQYQVLIGLLNYDTSAPF
jgi:phage recombination protein Bet